MMYFYHVPDFEVLIMKSIFPNKQRKLSHMIALNGHQYLLKDMLKQLNIYSHNCSGFQQNQITSPDFNQRPNRRSRTRPNQMQSQQQMKLNQNEYQFLNSIDRDFSTPLILALRNQKNMIVNLLL